MRTKKNPEIPMVPKIHLKNVEHQRNQYKTERDTLIDDLKVLREKNEKLKDIEKLLNRIRYKQSKTIEQLKQENEKLERENESLGYTKKIHLGHIRYFSNNNELLRDEVKSLKEENKALRLQSNTYFDEWQESEKQRNEFISYVNLYTILTDHIRLKAKNNPGVSRYIDLVNFIDRLEKGEM